MPRRVRSESGFYHVRLRGNGRQLLFLSDDDRRAFLAILDGELERCGVGLLAYCLMDNHVHLVMEDPSDSLSSCMHRVAMRYAKRFNESTGHVGHVFQGRFASSPIDDDAYLLGAVRYVHANPEKAGVCRAQDYPWSSFSAYAENGTGKGVPRVQTEPVTTMVGGPEGFLELSQTQDGTAMRVPLGRTLSDEERDRAVEAALGALDPLDVASLEGEAREKAVKALWQEGFSVRQIERLCGIGRSTVSRIVHR